MDTKTESIKNQPPVKLPKGCKLLTESDSYVLAECAFEANGQPYKQ